MGGEFLTVTLRELVCLVLAAVGFGLLAYPNSYVYLVSWLGGTGTQVVWLGLVLIVVAIYIFQKRPKFLEKVI